MNLARNLTIQTKLRDELLAASEWQFDLNLLKDLPYLNAVINEILRLYPVLLTNGIRKMGPDGATVAGRHIPPNTNIVALRYGISRC